MTWVGDFPAGFTAVPIVFTTHAATGGAVAPLSAFEAGDVKLYKDGSDVERTSTSGWTMTSPFDSTTGLHRLLIDLTDNTHSGFYAAGHVYTAVLTPDTETVDGLTVVKVIGTFGIDLTGIASAVSGLSTFDHTTDKVTPIDVDGLTHESAMEVLLAVLAGVASPSGSTVEFMKRDGTTGKITITYGAADGERTASVIA